MYVQYHCNMLQHNRCNMLQHNWSDLDTQYADEYTGKKGVQLLQTLCIEFYYIQTLASHQIYDMN